MNNGIRFEKKVARLYQKLGYSSVTHSKVFRVFDDDRLFKVQIDILYHSLFGKRYVECKYRSRSLVGLDEVAGFYSRLQLIGASSSSGEMVAHKGFDARAVAYAQSLNMKLYTADQLKYYTRFGRFGRLLL